jgi:hypothetical protein
MVAAVGRDVTGGMSDPSFLRHDRVGLAVGLAFVYGFIGVGVFVKLNFAGRVLEPMVGFQAAMAPIFVFAAVVAAADRPRLVPVVVIAPLVGAGVVAVGFVMVHSADPSVRDLVEAVVLVCGFLVGFVTSWATLGFVAGTVVRWRHRETVSRRTLAGACLGVVCGGLVVAVSYLVLVDFLSGLGDQLA